MAERSSRGTSTTDANGTFAASFTLSDQVVYAAFVVEDKTGQRIDANGRDLFEQLVHAEDGQVDSLAALVGQDSESPQWHALLESAEARMLPRIVADTVRWTPSSSSLADKNGNRVLLSDLIEGRNTVLVFWARSCGYSVGEIPQVLRLRELLESSGVQILSITTDDQPGPDMEEFIASRSVTYPVYYDLGAEAKNAFGVSGIPSYFVLDASGSVRFAFSQVADIPRQLEALVQLQGHLPPEP